MWPLWALAKVLKLGERAKVLKGATILQNSATGSLRDTSRQFIETQTPAGPSITGQVACIANKRPAGVPAVGPVARNITAMLQHYT
jgi:hypothetical protein